jgi:4-amino-4-deoxy-L-arabinose transferase-like glycosyltransferase
MAETKGTTLPLLLLLCSLSVVMHLKAFAVSHSNGDEVVYRALGDEMNWDLTHYTTRDHPKAGRFSWPLYRAPLFVHPPLLPLVLKASRALGDATVGGLAFLAAAMCLLLVLTQRALRSLNLSFTASALALGLAAACPVLLLSTMRLVPDGLVAIFLFAGISLAIEAFRKESARKMCVAGLLVALGLNAKYVAIIALPILPALQAFYLYQKRPAADEVSAARNPRSWRLFAILVAPVLLLGLQHHARFLLEYGTLLPTHLVTPDAGATLGRWSQSVYARTHFDMLWYLAAVFPLLGIFVFPQVYSILGQLLRERRWECTYVGIFLYLFCVLFAFQHNEMRYLAPAMPFLYISVAVIWDAGDRALKRKVGFLLVLSVVAMITTGYQNTIVWPKSIKVVPSLIEYVPLLQRFYL